MFQELELYHVNYRMQKPLLFPCRLINSTFLFSEEALELLKYLRNQEHMHNEMRPNWTICVLNQAKLSLRRQKTERELGQKIMRVRTLSGWKSLIQVDVYVSIVPSVTLTDRICVRPGNGLFQPRSFIYCFSTEVLFKPSNDKVSDHNPTGFIQTTVCVGLCIIRSVVIRFMDLHSDPSIYS